MLRLVTVVDAFASQPHYLDHLAPIWRALPVENRGHLLVGRSALHRANQWGLDQGEDRGRGDIALVAAWGDAVAVRRWPTVALMEHGVGQTYREGHSSYAGGQGRGQVVDWFLCPNDRVADLNRAACPQARVTVIGSPWLDYLAGLPRAPTVDAAVSFHWDLVLNPETRSTVGYWWPAVRALATDRSLLIHGHPRVQATLFPVATDTGLPTVDRFEDVVARAPVFVADNTSCLYFAAALGLGVVVLNAPSYRRHIDHGLRFWDMADVGVQVNDRGVGLADAVTEASAGPSDRAMEIVGELFPWRDRAVERAVSELVGHNARISWPGT